MFSVILFWFIAISMLMIGIYKYLDYRNQSGMPEGDDGSRGPQMAVASMIAMVSVASIAYKIVLGSGLGQTSALFVGVPAILALATVFTPAKSAMGIAFKSVTIGLLISLMFLGEGAVCVLMSAPLFYLVAYLIGMAANEVRNPQHFRRLSGWVMLLSIGPMSLEGTTSMTTIDRNVTVSESRVVNAAADVVAAALHQRPRFDRALPLYLSIGFPRPTSTHIDGDRWVIRMRGGELQLNGMEPRTGDLVLEKDGEGPGFINWRAVSDDSHMTHYLNWRSSRVEWQAIDARTTRVTWTLGYERGLDPAWYFGPMERYAMHLAAGYLIDSVATP